MLLIDMVICEMAAVSTIAGSIEDSLCGQQLLLAMASGPLVPVTTIFAPSRTHVHVFE